jgi:hypothetical protein
MVREPSPERTPAAPATHSTPDAQFLKGVRTVEEAQCD